jgi:hypothetical protein
MSADRTGSAIIFMVAAAAMLCSPGAAAEPPRKSKTQKSSLLLGNRSLEMAAKEICVLSGAWASGEPLRYEAWDKCSALSVRSVPAGELAEQLRSEVGPKRPRTDIPVGAEVIEVANDFSRVLIYRGPGGETLEVLVGD